MRHQFLKSLFIRALSTGLILTTLLSCNPASIQRFKYGAKIQYAQGEPLNFPDVTLEFIGITETPSSDLYPRSMYDYEFNVFDGNQSLIISWSAGTGDIGPTVFELDGKSYALELAMSDKLGKLKKNELVLWRVDE